MTHVLTSIFFPLLQKISPVLSPISGLKRLESGVWQSTDNDPQFIAKSPFVKVLSGWISVRVKIDSENIMIPKLYFDFGEGYSEARVIYMSQIDESTYQAELMLPESPRSIRFDPTEELSTFTVSLFQIRAHSEILHIAHQFVSIMKHDYKNSADTLRILKKSYARYKRHRLNGMLERLEKEYKKLHPYRVQRATSRNILYLNWIRENEKNNNEIFDKDLFDYVPIISVVMATYNTPAQYLKKAIDSVIDQSYPNWELCIADDASTNQKTVDMLDYYKTKYENIKVVYREKNGHISEASNSALTLASGKYVAFLDHDDMLSKNALYEVSKVINQNQNLKLIYSDEDKIDAKGKRFEPHFKSDWNPDMFYSHNYISHLSVIKRELVKKVGGFRVGYEGAQDYDLLLRVLDGADEDEIMHIKKILYHWRAIVGSTALDATQKDYTANAGLKALSDYFSKKDTNITVEKGIVPNTYKVNYPLPALPPLVSIIIPTRDGFEILSKCVQSIVNYTTYKNYEIIILDNETTDPKTIAYFNKIKEHKNISVLEYHYPFNYSAINNFGVKHAKGEVIALLNNDVEIITENWLSEMIQHALRLDIGAVGAMLYYDNDTIQHAGVVLGVGGVANHSHKLLKRGSFGYFARLVTLQNYSAVTAACLVVRKELYEKVDGLNEKDLTIAFNDVDFCLKLLEEGKRNIWTPYVELYHHESVSRGVENTEEKKERFECEVTFMKKRWRSRIEDDIYYNPNLTKINTDFGLNNEVLKGKV